MPNYLARVAAAGARTRPDARPAATAPPMLAGRPQSDAREPLVPAAPQPDATDTANSMTGSQPARSPDAPPAEQVITSPAAPDLSDEIRPNPAPAAGPAPATSGEPPTPRIDRGGPRLAASPPTFETAVVRVPRRHEAANPSEPPSSPRLGDAAASPAETVVRAPRALAAERARATPAKSAGSQGPPGAAPGEATISGPQPPRAPAISTMRTESSNPSPPLDAGSVAGLGPRPPARREARVSIGQIDVQVINQPPPVAARPSAPVAASGGLQFPATGEFERFRCRLP